VWTAEPNLRRPEERSAKKKRAKPRCKKTQRGKGGLKNSGHKNLVEKNTRLETSKKENVSEPRRKVKEGVRKKAPGRSQFRGMSSVLRDKECT